MKITINDFSPDEKICLMPHQWVQLNQHCPASLFSKICNPSCVKNAREALRFAINSTLLGSHASLGAFHRFTKITLRRTSDALLRSHFFPHRFPSVHCTVFSSTLKSLFNDVFAFYLHGRWPQIAFCIADIIPKHREQIFLHVHFP